MRTVSLIAVVCGSAFLAGCNSDTLVFGKVNTLGIQIAATAPDQGGNLTLGYRAANIAVVPVVAHSANGEAVPVFASTTQTRDAFSTFAHFEVTAGAQGAPLTACLGDTFATGIAAQRVAQALPGVCRRATP
jgi:hypothetical protein